MKIPRFLLSAIGLCSAMGVVHGAIAAEAWPTKPITVIVGYPAGGSNDIVGRIVAKGLTERLGVQAVVDNRTGAAGSIGAEAAARAKPDGYTLYMMSSAQALAPSIRKGLNYDPVASYDPIALAVSTTYVLAVNPKDKATNVRELIDEAKARPGQMKYASSGIGAGIHLTSERFKSLAGLDIVHVPYRGDTPMITDLMGGHVQMAFIPIPGARSYVTSGALRGLAVTSDTRISALPDVPTFEESGGPKGLNMSAWWGLVAPAGTPKDVLDKIEGATVQTLKSEEVQRQFAELAFEPGSLTREDFRRFIAEDKEKFAEIIRASNIKVE
ncbi:tripartite tricarboxylate transporter substrate binding protein [Alcaligenaceae bacterium]|nr:tripartite tricarboxylate transporter substrate binding protein [Alcaligenaceae bacterium]